MSSMTLLFHLPAAYLCCALFYQVTTASCPDGLFGEATRCDKKCHCVKDGPCDHLGQCKDGAKCEKGWFGPGCQFSDVVTDFENLTLSGDGKCPKYSGVINSTLILSVNLYFTWLRFTIRDADAGSDLEVMLENDGQLLSCEDQILVMVDELTGEIHCKPGHYNDIHLLGPAVPNLCKVHVNGGRNMGLKQPASQSSTHEKRSSQLAVNGVVETGEDGGEKCATTAPNDEKPSWSVKLPRWADISRVIIHTTPEGLETTLQDLQFLGLNEDGESLKGRMDKNVTAKMKHTIIRPFDSLVNQLIITASKTLVLCEVEIYGEFICPKGYYGITCSHKCRCIGAACTTSTGACPDSCVQGFTFVGCRQLCLPNSRMVECMLNECYQCWNNSCSKVKTTCDAKCSPGYTPPPKCDKTCPKGHFGVGCELKCDSCANDICDPITGICMDGCADGHVGNECYLVFGEIPCPQGFWGEGCKTPCSTDCKNNSCDKGGGACLECADGYRGVSCDTTCKQGNYGPACALDCPEECADRTCNHITGTCDDRGGTFDNGVFIIACLLLGAILLVGIAVAYVWPSKKKEPVASEKSPGKVSDEDVTATTNISSVNDVDRLQMQVADEDRTKGNEPEEISDVPDSEIYEVKTSKSD